MSIIGWQKLPGAGERTTKVTTRLCSFSAYETEKLIAVSVDPASIFKTDRPDRLFGGDAGGHFYVSNNLQVSLTSNEAGKPQTVFLKDVSNPFVVPAAQHPVPGPAVSLPTLSIRHSDAGTMEEDGFPKTVRSDHNAKLIVATDKQGNVLASLTLKIETLAPKNSD